MDKNDDRQIVQLLLDKADEQEKARMLLWANELISIRNSELSIKEKLTATFKAARHYKALLPALKGIKSKVWDERGIKTKIGLSGVVLVAVMFPGNAGLAAMGSAIGIPLWVVFGAGYSFAVLLIKEIKQTLKHSTIDAEYEVVDTDQEQRSSD